MQRILVPVDRSEGANEAAKFAGRLARDTGAATTLLFVYDSPTAAALGLRHGPAEERAPIREAVSQGSFEAARRAIGDTDRPVERSPETIVVPNVGRRAIGDTDRPVEVQIGVGHPVEAICSYAEREKADLIVTGTRGQSEVRSLLLGSVSEGVLRHAPCPVAVVRGSSGARSGRRRAPSATTAAWAGRSPGHAAGVIVIRPGGPRCGDPSSRVGRPRRARRGGARPGPRRAGRAGCPWAPLRRFPGRAPPAERAAGAGSDGRKGPQPRA